MFTIAGFMFDAVILWSLGFEVIGCVVGCIILRSSGDFDGHNDGCDIGTGVAFSIFSLIALCNLGYWGYSPFRWASENIYGLGILAGVYVLVGFVASGIWFGSWMRLRVRTFTMRRQDWLSMQKRPATTETPIPDDLKAAWQRYLKDSPSTTELATLPPFSMYRAYLGRRIAWWPLYLVNWIVCDLLSDLFNALGRLMGRLAGLVRKLYEDVARRYLSEISADAPES